jgi:hypothetical protein
MFYEIIPNKPLKPFIKKEMYDDACQDIKCRYKKEAIKYFTKHFTQPKSNAQIQKKQE